MRSGIVRVRVVKIIRGQKRHIKLFRELDEVEHRATFNVDAMVHYLGEEVLFAEDILELGCRLTRLVIKTKPKLGLNLATDTTGSRDDAFGVLAEQLAVHARLEVKTLNRSSRRKPEEVVHALVVLGEQRHMRVGTAAAHVIAGLIASPPPHTGLVPAVSAWRHISFCANDRLNALGRRLLPEIVSAKHVAMVGDRDGRHTLLNSSIQQRSDASSAIEHRILTVNVQMHKRVVISSHRHSEFFRNLA